MARIRTVKPELFRHEELNDIENEHPELRPILVFIGLFTQCDKNGVFPWKPRHIKLDILPFVNFDIGASLLLLRENGFIYQREHEGKEYGVIPTFGDHQRISGKEATEKAKYPEPCEMIEFTKEGSTWEAPGKHLGAQEREREREKEREKEREREMIEGSKEPSCSGNDPEVDCAPKKESCPYREIIELYHVILSELPTITEVSDTLRKRIKCRWMEKGKKNIDWWRTYFTMVAASDFLCGRKKDWRSDLFWLTGPQNMTKVINGAYKNNEPQAVSHATTSKRNQFREMVSRGEV